MKRSSLIGLVGEIAKIPLAEKQVDVWSQADGMSMLLRTTDGKAYEITIRPASETKHPGLQKKTKKRLK